MAKKRIKKGPKLFFISTFIIILIYIVFDMAEFLIMKTIPRYPLETHLNDYYTNEDFGFLTVKSLEDYNKNGIDDQTDILIGAKKYAELNPSYSSGYYAGGYPPETEGVCTDLIWFSIKEAGYLLKDLIAKDIRERYETTYNYIDIIDDNIDFRRVGNQENFFKKYAENLEAELENTTLIYFQPGDIITFDNSDHIAIISNKRNEKGIPYVIQNSNEEQLQKEEDVLESTPMTITGHYRFTYTDNLQSLIYRVKHQNDKD